MKQEASHLHIFGTQDKKIQLIGSNCWRKDLCILVQCLEQERFGVGLWNKLQIQTLFKPSGMWLRSLVCVVEFSVPEDVLQMSDAAPSSADP